MAHVVYPAVIEKGELNYGVFFPDLPGCVSAGETIAEAVQGAHEALAMHILGMIEDGERLPEPTAIEAVRPDPPEEDIAAILLIGANVPSNRSRSVEVTLDESLLQEIDALGTDRSRFLSDAARVELARRAAG